MTTTTRVMGNYGGEYDTAEAAVAYPGSALVPLEFFDRSASRSSAAVTGTVPASSPYSVKGPIPLDQEAVTVTVGGNSRTLVFGTTAASGQVAIDKATGLYTFHSSDASGAFSVTMKAWLTPASADFLHLQQAELRAAQLELLRLRAGLVVPVSIQTNATAAVSSVIAEVMLPGGLESFTLTGVTIVAPAFYGNGSQAGASNVEICIDGTFTTKKTASIGASATIARTDVSSTPLVLDDTGGDQFFLRFAASPGQHFITNVILEGKLKDES